MTHADGDTDGPRRVERRRARTGVFGIALFVGGPVLGAALAVLGLVLGVREDVRWLVLVIAGLIVGFGVTWAGLRILVSLEEARTADAREMPDESADPTDAPREAGPDA
ncbi:hypothetical protein GCM10009819_23790 [Agromyces tropicus]|uniref:AtpZ/AtpI family protein n=1 Tax=Agromyces tropicus TaxID=555371 RepID=A0ABN2UKS0_9MICO